MKFIVTNKVLLIFGTQFIRRSYGTTRNSSEYPWGPKLEAFAVVISEVFLNELDNFRAERSYPILEVRYEEIRDKRIRLTVPVS
jgi:hypothetical protein